MTLAQSTAIDLTPSQRQCLRDVRHGTVEDDACRRRSPDGNRYYGNEIPVLRNAGLVELSCTGTRYQLTLLGRTMLDPRPVIDETANVELPSGELTHAELKRALLQFLPRQEPTGGWKRGRPTFVMSPNEQLHRVVITLERRGLVTRGDDGEYLLTDAGYDFVHFPVN